MSEDQVEHFIQLNFESSEEKLAEILNRISKNDMQIDVNQMLGERALDQTHNISNKKSVEEDALAKPKQIIIDKSVEKMFNHMIWGWDEWEA